MAMSEYDQYLMRYGAPTAQPVETAYANSLAGMEGDRVLGGTYGRGVADRAKAIVQANIDAANAPALAAAEANRKKALRDKVFADAKVQYDKALKANIDQENAIKKGYADRRARALESLGKNAGSAQAEINRRFDMLAADARNRAATSGTGNTSILTTTLQGIERERAAALAAAYDTKTQREVGYDSQLSGDELGFQERVQNQYPSMDTALAMAKLEGQGSQAGIDPNAYGGAGGAYGGAPVLAGGYGYGPASFGFGGIPGFGWQQPTAAVARPNRAAVARADAAGVKSAIGAAGIPGNQMPNMVVSRPGAAAGGAAPVGGGAVPGGIGWTNPWATPAVAGASGAGGPSYPFDPHQNDPFERYPVQYY